MQVLDKETLMLLRTCAMEAISDIQTNHMFRTEEELYSHLSSISETHKYFRLLKMAIGTKSNGSYFVSESVLERAYGKYQSASALREETLNYITQFICDMNWKQYNSPKGRKEARERILGRLIKPEKKSPVNAFVASCKPHMPAVFVKEGDKILIEHTDGSFDTYIFSNGEYKPLINNADKCA